MVSDLQNIQYRVFQGDPRALKQLYDLTGNQLLQLAIAVTGSRELSEEIVEDVFIRIWERRGYLDKVENLKWYLYVSVRNIASNYLRKHRSRFEINLDEIHLPQLQVDANPEDLMVTAEVMRKVNQAINELPSQCRLIFKLVKEDGLKYREVAVLLHLSVKTVENQMGIALKKLHLAMALYLPARFTTIARSPR